MSVTQYMKFQILGGNGNFFSFNFFFLNILFLRLGSQIAQASLKHAMQ